MQVVTVLCCRPALADISSPDLGVEMESDPFSSLERQLPGSRGQQSLAEDVYQTCIYLCCSVGSLTLDKIVSENRALRRDREQLAEKLGRSKTALQETLTRLSKSNMAKQDQVSPGQSRRPPSRRAASSASMRGGEREGGAGRGAGQQGTQGRTGKPAPNNSSKL